MRRDSSFWVKSVRYNIFTNSTPCFESWRVLTGHWPDSNQTSELTSLSVAAIWHTWTYAPFSCISHSWHINYPRTLTCMHLAKSQHNNTFEDMFNMKWAKNRQWQYRKRSQIDEALELTYCIHKTTFQSEVCVISRS